MITNLKYEDLSLLKDLEEISKWKFNVTGDSPYFEVNNLPKGLIQDISIVLRVENGESIEIYRNFEEDTHFSVNLCSSQKLKPCIKNNLKFVWNSIKEVKKIRIAFGRTIGKVEIEEIKIFYLPSVLEDVSETNYNRLKYILKFQPLCDHYLSPICDPKNKSILVIGAGYGTEMLWCICNGAKKVVGIDITSRDTNVLKIALEQMEIHSNCKFEILKMSVEEIEKISRKFDIILSNNVFEHLPNIEEALNVCKKMIKPYEGRIAIFTDPLFYSSTGSHIPLAQPWEHLWENTDIISKTNDFHCKEYNALNRVKFSDFIKSIESNDLVILKLDIVIDRNLENIRKYLKTIDTDESITNLAIEGISLELMRIDSE